jgi:addiction module HigA family antidote
MSKQKHRRIRPPIHPGEILKEEFMADFSLSANALARLISVPPNRIIDIVNGKRGITVDTAIRLAKCFGTTPQFWTGLQADYDFELADYSNLTKQIQSEVRQAAIA